MINNNNDTFGKIHILKQAVLIFSTQKENDVQPDRRYTLKWRTLSTWINSSTSSSWLQIIFFSDPKLGRVSWKAPCGEFWLLLGQQPFNSLLESANLPRAQFWNYMGWKTSLAARMNCWLTWKDGNIGLRVSRPTHTQLKNKEQTRGDVQDAVDVDHHDFHVDHHDFEDHVTQPSDVDHHVPVFGGI